MGYLVLDFFSGGKRINKHNIETKLALEVVMCEQIGNGHSTQKKTKGNDQVNDESNEEIKLLLIYFSTKKKKKVLSSSIVFFF